METKEGDEDMRNSVLTLLQDLEYLSRRLCNGCAIDPSRAERVISLLADLPELRALQNNLEGVVSSLEASGVNGGSENTTAEMVSIRPHRLKWVSQMSEALKKLKLESEDLDHRVSFVNAAIEFMNFLRRRMKIEHEILFSSMPMSRSSRRRPEQPPVCESMSASRPS